MDKKNAADETVCGILLHMGSVLIQLDSFEQVSKAGSDALRLRNVHFLYRLFFHFLKSLHAEADLSVLESDNFHSDFVAGVQKVPDARWPDPLR